MNLALKNRIGDLRSLELFCYKSLKFIAHQYCFIIFFRSHKDLEATFLIETLCCPERIHSDISTPRLVTMRKV